MEITVKNVKVAEFASEETLCFQATVYVDGKRSFTAHNDGQGGCNYYDPVKGKDYEVVRKAEAYAQTLPPMESEYFEDGLPYDLDLLVGDLVQRYQDDKELKAVCRKWIVFREKDAPDSVLYTGLIKRKFVPERDAEIFRIKYPDNEVVNLRFI